jgi:hypothetical protein
MQELLEKYKPPEPFRLHFIPWRLIFVGPEHETCFISPFWHLELHCSSYILVKFVHPTVETETRKISRCL